MTAFTFYNLCNVFRVAVNVMINGSSFASRMKCVGVESDRNVLVACLAGCCHIEKNHVAG